MNESGGCERKWGAQLVTLGPDISAMETDFHTKSTLSLAGLGSLWYENRANPSSSSCCHVFILQTRCPFINLWLALALRLKRLVLNELILDCCCRSSKRTLFLTGLLRCWIVQQYHYVTLSCQLVQAALHCTLCSRATCCETQVTCKKNHSNTALLTTVMTPDTFLMFYFLLIMTKTPAPCRRISALKIFLFFSFTDFSLKTINFLNRTIMAFLVSFERIQQDFMSLSPQ